MLDFTPGERLYAVGIDPNDPLRAVGCVYLKPRPGSALVQFANQRAAVVPLNRICKIADDAIALAKKLAEDK